MTTGYSNKSLSAKLGIKEGFKVYLKNEPVNYFDLLIPIPKNISFKKRISGELDFVHFFVEEKKEFQKEIIKLKEKIKKDGMIWISWPKKSSKIPTNITEDIIREVILPLGLVDIKVCAVDETWSGLKLVIRKELR